MSLTKGFAIAASIAALAIGGAAVMSAARREQEALAKFELYPAGVVPLRFTHQSIDLNIRYRIVNPASATLYFRRMRFSVLNSAGTPIGEINNPVSAIIPANGASVISLPAVLFGSGALSFITGLIMKPTEADNYEIRLLGYVLYESSTLGTLHRYPVDMKFDLREYLPLLKKLYETRNKAANATK